MKHHKLGLRCKAIRKAFNFSQQKMAQQFGVEQPKISKIEKGNECSFLYTNLQSLQTKLNINLNWLICGIGNPTMDNTDQDDLINLFYREFLKVYQNKKDEKSTLSISSQPTIFPMPERKTG